MKTLKIKRITLVNFKGIRRERIVFNDSCTVINGGNGTGKTTIFDAFVWCLFGKDSQNRKQFNIKTLDSEGKAISKIPHEVELELLVDGQVVRLKRTYIEKWQKKRGNVSEEFVGHEESRYYNDVPCSVSEFGEKIDAICKEEVFKMLTNPNYFLSQKDDVQRAMLFRMSGDVSDADIAKGNIEFTALLDALQGKSVEEYRKEVLAQCKRLKNEIKDIPVRIEEVQRNLPIIEDLEGIKRTLAEHKRLLKEAEENINNKTKAYESGHNKLLAITESIGQCKERLQALALQAKESSFNTYNKQKEEQLKLKAQVSANNNLIALLNNDISGLQVSVEECVQKRTELVAEWKKIKATRLVFNDDDFVCPTCKRPFEEEEIESKKAELLANFNENQAKLLADNTERGKKNNSLKEAYLQKIAEKQSEVEGYQKANAAIEANPLYSAELQEPQVSEDYKQSEEYKKVEKELEGYMYSKSQMESSMGEPDVEQYKLQKETLLEQIAHNEKELYKEEVIKKGEARISELQEQLQKLNVELATYEKEDFLIQQFSKAKANAITDKINALFAMVRFRLFETQINGGEVECCKATINGVPYSDANNASKINAGLDIINAICKYEGVTAPIFIDNAESVNELLSTASQQIRLVVTKDKELKVEA